MATVTRMSPIVVPGSTSSSFWLNPDGVDEGAGQLEGDLHRHAIVANASAAAISASNPRLSRVARVGTPRVS